MRRSYRMKARERAEKHYSWDAVVSMYEDLFRKLLGL